MKLTTDSVDMVVASPAFMTATGVQEFEILSLLYLFDSFDHWEKSIDGEFGETMKRLITEKTNNDFKVVGYYSSGVRNFYGKKPIQVPSDAAGLNIRTQSSAVQQEFWKKAGANPISVGWQELYQALNTGSRAVRIRMTTAMRKNGRMPRKDFSMVRSPIDPAMRRQRP